MNRSLALLLLSISSACAGASSSAAPSGAASAPQPAATPAAVATAGPKSKVICRTERPLGSNIARTVCNTQEELDAQSQAAQDAMRLAPKSGSSKKSD